MIDQIALNAAIDAAEARAYHGCGLSDVLYEPRVQPAYASILERAPESDREEVAKVLRQRGFIPEFVPYKPEEGECGLTGVDQHSCPCGRHP